MMYEPAQLKEIPARTNDRILQNERAFHRRAFGEEMARLNWELTPAERRGYLQWMHSDARNHGVPPTSNYSIAWMLRLEEDSRND